MLALRVAHLSIAARSTVATRLDPLLVRDVSFTLESGKVLALVGESGSGKSLTAKALLGLLPQNLYLQNGAIEIDNHALQDATERQWQALRGREIAMISQNPMNAFNPTMSIGKQLEEVLAVGGIKGRYNVSLQRDQLLAAVGLKPELSKAYSFEMSGGMLQRAMIAMSLAANPKVLVSDEVTTALDVITQQHITTLLAELVENRAMAMLFISHDLGLVAQVADEVAVMYAGEIVERGAVSDVLKSPRHPYTQDLLAATPQRLPIHPRNSAPVLQPIPGSLPKPQHRITHCVFSPRCRQAMRICHRQVPPNQSDQSGHCWNCWMGVNKTHA